jgi:hypothetical protein
VLGKRRGYPKLKALVAGHIFLPLKPPVKAAFFFSF